MSETRWWKYVERLIGNDTAQEAARRARFSKSAFTRWKQGANADPEFVVKLARAYHANVLEALVEAEFITEAEAGLKEVAVGRSELLASIPIDELMNELQRRITVLTQDADSKTPKPEEDNNIAKVHSLTPRDQAPTLDELEDEEYVAMTRGDLDPDEDVTDHDYIP
ncbi:helix-turn-helix domain-containing protein [Rhodococcus zopfii]|uniref:Helix-turn-helix domain-containing protein n=1 Tax=Rhodococcus zopfii TaxID=43772 RepID=A0ABU3WKP9_9NOCA|nr:helix-turn-helix domain-containing protein [Rhodococcus zopfii]MDV2478575.1 helix-turn-helix domain-containing protein [Rhodococcus zopfii]